MQQGDRESTGCSSFQEAVFASCSIRGSNGEACAVVYVAHALDFLCYILVVVLNDTLGIHPQVLEPQVRHSFDGILYGVGEVSRMYSRCQLGKRGFGQHGLARPPTIAKRALRIPVGDVLLSR